MIKLLIPPIILVLGAGAGVFGGSYLRPAEETSATVSDGESEQKDTAAGDSEEEASVEFIKFNNQFIVPVVEDDAVRSLVVVSLGLEMMAGETGSAFSAEPKLRDLFLQILFDHANIGGFDAEFTNARNLDFLKDALTISAQSILGDSVVSVLITDLARQDV